ncbi:MAG TPA: rRNA adenine N-6-methyltransferase family protein [Puia sp.]|jgi:protein-L-isoaspartate O-methyltransferase|nr:rRNA adenine N-6-methyltransferase family protein [Puia sp.]
MTDTASSYDVVEATSEYLLGALRSSKDLSTSSEELQSYIRDRTTRFHLAPQRADLLRPFAGRLYGNSVIELGSGGGALTRYLAECGARVTAVENDVQLAVITGERCRDLDHVTVVNADPASFETPSRFDFAIVIDNPELIPKAANLLKPHGILILTGGNSTVLLYLLHANNLTITDLYIPFPDHLFPTVLLTERARTISGFEPANLVHPHSLPCPPQSFLITAGKTKPNLTDPAAVAWSFNSSRRKPFNKMNVFYESPPTGIRVNRVPHDPDAWPDPGLLLTQVLRDEAYVPGALYSQRLTDIVSSPGWSVEDLQRWARPYVDFLKTRASLNSHQYWMEGIYADLVPFNLLSRDGQRFVAIDLEWVIKEMIPLEYVLFRGLYHTIFRLGPVQRPSPRTPLNVFGLCLAVLEGILPDTSGILEDFYIREVAYFAAVSPTNSTPSDSRLLIAEPGDNEPGIDYPLLNLNLQIFVGTAAGGFQESTSVKHPIGLTRRRQTFTLTLADFPADATSLRIDPSDHPGMFFMYGATIRKPDGAIVFHWTPGSDALPEGQGVTLLNPPAEMPGPVFLLQDYDPMMIFPLPAIEPLPALFLDLELAALSAAQCDHILNRPS